MEPNEVAEQVAGEQVEPAAVPQTEDWMKMRRVFLGLGAVVLLAVGGVSLLLYSPPSEAAPTVKWSPSSLYASLAAGESTTTTATFMPTANATNVTVAVVPELAPYVSVSPTSYASVQKGQSYPVAVTMRAPADMVVGVYDGTIQLRQGTKTLAVPLAVDLTFSPIPLPPDPGEAGKLTIEGIDSDGDGVRDDVQRWIVLSFPDQPAIRAGLRQFAIAQQRALLDAESEELALINRDEKDRARGCLAAIAGLHEGYRYFTSLEAQMLNTRARSLAYIQYDSHLRGHVFHLTDVTLGMCDFDPANI
jgi:hypothetical protein